MVTNRQIPRAELRRRIGAAAMVLWREHGFDAVSVDQIVSRAAVSKGAFFVFFPTKADALVDYYRDLDSRLAALRSRIDPARPLSGLETFFVEAEALLRAEGGMVRTLFREVWVRPALRALDQASGVDDRRQFTALFDAAQHAGAIDADLEPAMAAELIADIWTGSVLAWLADDQAYSLADAIRPKLRLAFSGLQP